MALREEDGWAKAGRQVSELAIADYALLSDCRSAALVSRGGSVDWLCFPRFDGRSVFARLLDEDAGHFAIRPASQARASRRCLDQTMVLETTFRTSTGTAAVGWREKDQGMWEIRGEPRDFLYSKLMCWVALDRAIALSTQLDAQEQVREWAAARDEIRTAILERGWSEQAGAFTQAFGSHDLDASSLMLTITGFLPGDDPRMKATIDAIATRLTDERGLVYRYLTHDGLEGEEGTFLLCTFWLAQAQALAGELDQASRTAPA